GLVIFTVVAHGFTIRPFAKKLNLSLEGNPGVLIVGSNKFTVKLAKSLLSTNTPVLIVDASWEDLSYARHVGITLYHGDILSEQSEYNIDTIAYEYLGTGTEEFSYNALVCTTFRTEYGRTNVFKVDPDENEKNESNTVASVGGNSLFRKEN